MLVKPLRPHKHGGVLVEDGAWLDGCPTCEQHKQAMTPPDMVTDAEAAEIAGAHEAVKRQAWLEVGRVEYEVCIRDNEEWPCSTSRLLAFRKRLLGLLTGLLAAVDCLWEEDGTCTPENCMKEEAKALLEGVHRDA